MAITILAGTVVAAALAFPAAVTAERMARQRVIAATKVLDLMDHWGQGEGPEFDRNEEAKVYGQSTYANRPMDLDRYLNRARIGLLPLPPRLAARIDSQNDEIRSIVDAGGSIFYCEARPLEVGFDQRGIGLWDWRSDGMGSGDTGDADRRVAAASLTLLFAVRGYPQQNAVPTHPNLSWPYVEMLAAPPREYEYRNHVARAWPGTAEFTAVWEHLEATRPTIDLQHPGNAPGLDTGGPNVPPRGAPAAEVDAYYAALTANRAKNTLAIDEYVRLAKAFVSATGIPVDADGAPLPPDPLPGAGARLDANDPSCFPPPAWVVATRVLAHAAMYRTSSLCVPLADEAQRDVATIAYESSAAWSMRYAAADPYDWGAHRPLNRALCTDFPLLQYDLSGEPRIAANGDASWPITAPVQPHGYGESHFMLSDIFPLATTSTRAQIDDNWGNPRNLTLTARFAAAERCRTLICWSVDWTAFEDFESAPSAPMEATRHFLDSNGERVAMEGVSLPPERDYLWSDASRSAVYAWDRTAVWEYDDLAYKQRYLGVWGADRNGNGRFDVGPLPASARMRATTLARFAFYDRRISSTFK
ncbi:MAG TPA: hypothetical protein VEL07_02390 [Planctomycetota bacterium]|nr:hypothetical protein [Planctomycetota bacterium]